MLINNRLNPKKYLKKVAITTYTKEYLPKFVYFLHYSYF